MNRFIRVLLLGLVGLAVGILFYMFVFVGLPFIFIHAPYLILIFIVVFGVIAMGLLLDSVFFGGPNY